jgi:hypothetical protein
MGLELERSANQLLIERFQEEQIHPKSSVEALEDGGRSWRGSCRAQPLDAGTK